MRAKALLSPTLLTLTTSLATACAAPATAPIEELGREVAPVDGADKNASVPVKQPVITAETTVERRVPKATVVKTDTPADVAAPPAEAVKTPSGLSFKILRPGEGSEAGRNAKVVVHYAGWNTKGELFDSSVPRGEPLTIGLNQVIEGWREGVGAMKMGEVRRLWIPEALAYKGKSGAPAGMLVFDVELMQVL